MTEGRKGIFEVRSYDGKIKKPFSYYKRAYNFSTKLLRQDIYCGIWELVVDKNEDGTDNLDTLRWVQVIGC